MIIVVGMGGLTLGWMLPWVAYIFSRFSKLETKPRKGDLRMHLISGLFSGAFLVFLWMSMTENFVTLAMCYLFLMIIALIDLRYRIVPNVLTYPATLAVLIFQVAQGNVLSAVIGGVLAFGLFFLAGQLSPLGWGDVKLAVLIGLALGFPYVLIALLLGAGTAAVFAVILMKTRDEGFLPYAPFLCLGAMVALLVGVNLPWG